MKNNSRIVATVSLAVLFGVSAVAQQSPPQQDTVSTAQLRYISAEEGPGGPGSRPDGQGFGHAGGHFGPPGMWWKNPNLVQKLNLSADQQKHIDDIVQQSRIQLIHMKASLEEEEVLLEPLLAANPPDNSKVLAQVDKIAETRAELEKANAKMLLGIRGVLTADQWTKLQAERANFRRKFDEHNGPRFGPGRPGVPGTKGPGAPTS